MEKEQLIQLAEKVFNGTATEQEIAQYNHYVQYLQGNTEWDMEVLGDPTLERDVIFKNIQATITPKTRNYKKFVAVAATILIFLSVGYYVAFQTSTYQEVATEEFAVEDIAPGSNKAMLTLSDGSKITLDQMDWGNVAEQAGVQISKSNDGLLVYENINNNLHRAEAASLYNTLTIPEGGYYTVVLPDGTKVWLNASSNLTYPTQFLSDKREVELTGEAYFEVASQLNSKGKRLPFIVSTHNQEVEVLGTSFNISSYQDEAFTKTTLLEGLVKVHLKKMNYTLNDEQRTSVILKPNQQSTFASGSNRIAVADVDPEEAVAWKNNLFIFNDETLGSIMRKISRWYSVDVVFKDADPNRIYWGSVSRFENVSEVLNKLELTGSVRFEIEKNGTERRIVVMK